MLVKATSWMPASLFRCSLWEKESSGQTERHAEKEERETNASRIGLVQRFVLRVGRGWILGGCEGVVADEEDAFGRWRVVNCAHDGQGGFLPDGSEGTDG